MKKLVLIGLVFVLFTGMTQILSGQAGKQEDRRNPELKQKSKLPDLQVKKMWLGGDCQIYIEIVNNGPGYLKSTAYDMSNGAAVQMYRGTKAWGGIRLGVIDKNKVLKNPGGAVVYEWFPGTENLKLPSGINDLKVTVDNNNAVNECNESNNTLIKKLTCMAYISQVFPDSCMGADMEINACFSVYGSKFGSTQGNTIVYVNSQAVQAKWWNDLVYLIVVPKTILISGNQNQIWMENGGIQVSNKKSFNY